MIDCGNGIRFPETDGEVTVWLHVLEAEINQAMAALKAQGADARKAEPAVWFPKLVAELDRLLPALKIQAMVDAGEAVGVVSFKPERMPDTRIRRRPAPTSAQEAPAAPEAPQAEPAPEGHVEPILAVPVRQGSRIEAKIASVQWQAYNEQQLAQMAKLATELGGAPYPTHHGTISMDGKADVRVYLLSNGIKAVDAQDMQAFFGTHGGI